VLGACKKVLLRGPIWRLLCSLYASE